MHFAVAFLSNGHVRTRLDEIRWKQVANEGHLGWSVPGTPTLPHQLKWDDHRQPILYIRAEELRQAKQAAEEKRKRVAATAEAKWQAEAAKFEKERLKKRADTQQNDEDRRNIFYAFCAKSSPLTSMKGEDFWNTPSKPKARGFWDVPSTTPKRRSGNDGEPFFSSPNPSTGGKKRSFVDLGSGDEIPSTNSPKRCARNGTA